MRTNSEPQVAVGGSMAKGLTSERSSGCLAAAAAGGGGGICNRAGGGLGALQEANWIRPSHGSRARGGCHPARPPRSPDASSPMRGGPQPRRPGANQISIGFGAGSRPGPPPPLRAAAADSPPCDRAGRRPQTAVQLPASCWQPMKREGKRSGPWEAPGALLDLAGDLAAIIEAQWGWGGPLPVAAARQFVRQPQGPLAQAPRPTHPHRFGSGRPLQRPHRGFPQPECSRRPAQARLAPPLAAPAAAAPPPGGTPPPRAAGRSAGRCAWLRRPRPRRCWSARLTGRGCSPPTLMRAPSAVPSTPPAATPASPATTPSRCRCAAQAGRVLQPCFVAANDLRYSIQRRM